MEETAVTTDQKSNRVVAKKGRNSDFHRERISSYHGCGCTPPEWEFYPAILRILTKELQELLIARGSDDRARFAKESVWVNRDNFVLYVEHFMKHTRVTKDKPMLILLDSYQPHLDVNFLDLAKENGVVMSFPPHTSLKVQALDRSVHGPSKCL